MIKRKKYTSPGAFFYPHFLVKSQIFAEHSDPHEQRDPLSTVQKKKVHVEADMPSSQVDEFNRTVAALNDTSRAPACARAKTLLPACGAQLPDVQARL